MINCFSNSSVHHSSTAFATLRFITGIITIGKGSDGAVSLASSLGRSISHSPWVIIRLKLLFLLLIQFLGCQGENFLHIIARLSTSLKELVDVIGFAEIYCSLPGHLSLVFQVAPVAYQVNYDVATCVLLHLLQPVNHIHECIISSYIICQKNAVCSPVKYSCY